MVTSTQPAAELGHLPRTDGSATFSYCGYTVTAAVNGPIEAQRRDENPFEAILDVNVRPAAGVGGTAERQLESILVPALRQLIPIRNFPRSLIQITLQITETPENAYANTKIVQADLNLTLIPALFHASVLALLTAAIPLKEIATAVALAYLESGELIAAPDTRQSKIAASLHVMAFTSSGKMLLGESQGMWTGKQWSDVLDAGERICTQSAKPGDDEDMAGSGIESASIRDFIRATMAAKVADDLQWK